MQLKVAFAITELDVGGAEKNLTELVCRIDRNRFDPLVFVLSFPPSNPVLVERIKSQNVPLHFLGLRRWSQLPQILLKFAARLRLERPDLVQSFLFHANIASRIAARLAGIPVVVSGLRVAEHAARWHILVDCLTSSYVDHYVCVSQAVAKFAARNGLPPERITVIPNAIDPSRFSPENSPRKCDRCSCQGILPTVMSQQGPADASEEYRLVTVARLEYQKGVDWLLLAVANWIKRFPDLRLIIVGEGPLKSTLQDLINEYDLSRHAILAGFQRDVVSVLRGADLFLLPSRWEGMPNALLEAMATGLPVVATDVEGVREILGTHTDHQLIAPGDSDALKDAILWHYFHRESSQALGRRNRESVLAQFAWPNVVKQYENLWTWLVYRSRI
jgi:glycosyltransferase involved in cell wall biosynthesis